MRKIRRLVNKSLAALLAIGLAALFGAVPAVVSADAPPLTVYPVSALLPRPPSSVSFASATSLWGPPPVLALVHPEPAQQEQLISQFPATYYARDGGPIGQIQAQCTLTRIGPGVFLTAAHCFYKRRQEIAISAGSGRTVSARCAVPKNAPVNDDSTICSRGATSATGIDLSADWALCFAKEWKRLPSTKTEALAAKETGVSIGETLLVVGAGCNRPYNYSFDPKRPLTHGFPTVNAAIGTAPHAPNYFATGKTDWHSRKGDAPISYTSPQFCPGDSGAAVYTMSSLLSINVPRKIVGVASRACQTETNYGYVQSGPSWISSTTTEAFWSFLIDWAKRNDNPEICGYNVSNERAELICRR